MACILAGCAEKTEVPQEPVKLKVLALSEKMFMEKYGNFFLATHPEYELQVTPLSEHITFGDDWNQTAEQLIESDAPDLVSLDMNIYMYLRERGKLASLTPMIKESKMDTSGFAKGIIPYFTDEERQLTGLSPSFAGTALYYNKKLFSAEGVPFPRDGMTWNDVFELAQRFPGSAETGGRQFGYYDKTVGNPFLMALQIGEGSGLTFYADGTFRFGSKSWETIFRDIAGCFRTGVCFDKKLTNADAPAADLATAEMRTYPFLRGDIAMAVESSTLHGRLTARYPNMDWGIVSLPVNPAEPGLSNGVVMNDIFSIPVVSDHDKEAWAFILYICGEMFAKLLPNVDPDALPARLPTAWKDERLKAFYQFERITNTRTNTLRTLPVTVIAKMDEISPKYIGEMMADPEAVAKALADLDAELQQTLNAADSGG